MVILDGYTSERLTRFGNAVLRFDHAAGKPQFASTPSERLVEHLQPLVGRTQVLDLEPEFVERVAGDVHADDVAFARQ